MTRGPLAVTLALLLVALPIRATSSDPAGGATCSLDTPAPKGSARLTWATKSGGEGAPGTWVSDPAMLRSAAKMERCFDGWATCEVALSVEKGKRVRLGWKTWAISIGAALTVGFVAGMTRR